MTKNYLRTTALTCAALCVSMGLAVSQASAKDSKSVLIAQERLTNLGYYAGPADGAMGDITKNALRDFQANNGLAVTGALTNDTYQLLKDQDMAFRGGYAPQYAYGYRNNGYYGNRYAYNTAYGYGYVPASYAAAPASAYWNTARSEIVPIRFGQLAVNDNTSNGMHNYSVTLNGQPVLVANNQPQALRVSRTYRQNGEDTVIFTAYDGTGACSYRNYALTVRADGTYVSPQQVGDCSGAYQARIDSGVF